MVRAFASGVGRKLAYVLVGVVVAMVGHCAHAIGFVSSTGSVPQYVAPCARVGLAGVSSGTGGQAGNSLPTTNPQADTASNPCWNGLVNGVAITGFWVAPGTTNSGVSPPCSGGVNGAALGSGPNRGPFCSVFQAFGTAIGCPANSTASGGNCECNIGYRSANADGTGACVAYTCPFKALANDTNAGPYNTQPDLGSPLYYCDTARNPVTDNATYGCSITAGPYWAGAGADGKYWIRYVNAFNRSPCMGGGATQPSTPAPPIPVPPGNPASGVGTAANGDTPPSSSPCAKGTCPGTFNGQSMCLACSSETGTQNSTTTAPSGAASSPPGQQAGSTSTQTTCTGNACTTVVTSYSSGGVAIGQTTSNSTKGSVCAASPGNPVCAASGSASGAGSGSGSSGDSSFGGSCGAFSCSGDAIQCAIALDQYKRACTLFDTVTPEVTSGLAYIAEGAASSVRYVSQDIDIGARFTVLPANPFGSSCPPDQVIAGLTIPLSRACTALQLLGAIAVAITVLMSAMWLVNKGV